MGSPSSLSSSRPSPSAPSAVHPPSFQAISLELLNPIMAPVFLVSKVVLRKVGLTLPGQAIWQSWSERKQAFWAPFIYAAFLSIFALLTAHPTTSYFYPSSPGFYWTQTGPPHPSSTPSSDLPAGRWRWSFAGAPSSPGHPLAQEQTLSWYLFIWALPTVFVWSLFVTGKLGESDGRLFRTWLYGSMVATLALFVITYWWAGTVPDEREQTEKVSGMDAGGPEKLGEAR